LKFKTIQVSIFGHTTEQMTPYSLYDIQIDVLS